MRVPSIPDDAAQLSSGTSVMKMAVRLIHSSSLGTPVLGRLGSGVVLSRSTFSPLRPGYERAKRALDVSVCLFVLPPTLFVMAICALAVALCDGRPVFFLQERTGRGGRPFRMIKFRTMVVNAAELKAALAHRNRLSGPDFKIENDPRVPMLGAQ